MMSPDLDAVYRKHLEDLRRWGIAGAFAAYELADTDDLDESMPFVATVMAGVYGAAIINALSTTDEYMGLQAAIGGDTYTADWRKGRPDAPSLMFSGRPFRQWMALAAAGIKRLISEGLSPSEAVEVSRARAAGQVASQSLQAARSSTFNRFVADALIVETDMPPELLRPWTDEVEQYANLWEGQRRREYPGTWERWQRVPSPGACSFCLMLATRSNYTSADAAMYAGGAEGTERARRGPTNRLAGVSRRRTSKMESGDRYHRNCRCTVRMVSVGAATPISQEDYDRLSTRDENGDLPTFGLGKYQYTINDFDFEVVGPDAGIAMPPKAPWQDARLRAEAAERDQRERDAETALDRRDAAIDRLVELGFVRR